MDKDTFLYQVVIVTNLNRRYLQVKYMIWQMRISSPLNKAVFIFHSKRKDIFSVILDLRLAHAVK